MTYVAGGRLLIFIFFPLHKSGNTLRSPVGPIMFIGLYPKTTVQGYNYKTIHLQHIFHIRKVKLIKHLE